MYVHYAFDHASNRKPNSEVCLWLGLTLHFLHICQCMLGTVQDFFVQVGQGFLNPGGQAVMQWA